MADRAGAPRAATLWVEGYGPFLTDPGGPWSGFAATTVRDWLTLFADAGCGPVEVKLLLAVQRGALLATGDVDRTSAAVRCHLNRVYPA